MTLVMCLSLTIPVFADSSFSIDESDKKSQDLSYVSSGSGIGWSYDGETLTLNGFHGKEIYCHEGIVDIILAPGSKNTVEYIWFENLFGGEDDISVSFSGSGELVINGQPNDNYPNSPFFCKDITATLNDGLAITGGSSSSDFYPVFFDLEGYAVANAKIAPYIRISPFDSSKSSPTPTPFTDVPATSPYVEAVNWAIERKITTGKTDTTFGPNDICTISHILTFLCRATNRYDTKEKERAAVDNLAGFLEIDSNDLDKPCTRATAVSYLWRTSGSEPAKAPASFIDVPLDSPYARPVSWAVENKITSGTSDTTFSPDNVCTRGQIVTFLYRLLH